MSERSAIKAIIETSKGTINIRLFEDDTPVTVASFINLVQRGYYDSLMFHRVLPDFMIQGGCPQGNGTGGPGYQFEDECSDELPHDTPGKLSMANAGPGTNGSQFFITHVETSWLNGKHTVFGEVVDAEDQKVVNSIEQGDKIISIKILDDASELLNEFSDRVKEWNEVLDLHFPID